MSYRATVAVFDYSEARLAARLVLLALAEYAHDDGSNAYPSVTTLARKSKCDERTVQRALRWLERACEIVATGSTTHGVTIYHLTVVSRLAYPLPPRPGDKLPPEGFLVKDGSKTSGDKLSPEDDRTERRPPGGNPTRPAAHLAGVRTNALSWIDRHVHDLDRGTAAMILEDSLGIAGDELERALAYYDRRRTS